MIMKPYVNSPLDMGYALIARGGMMDHAPFTRLASLQTKTAVNIHGEPTLIQRKADAIKKEAEQFLTNRTNGTIC